MSLTVTIAGSGVTVLEKSFKLSDKVDERSRCSFTVLDATGTLALQKGQPVSVVDSGLGTLFTGYVNQPSASKLYPNAARLWSVDCVDQTYLLDKRVSDKIYRNQFAGTIVADQIQRYGATENVTGAFALRWDELEADWQTGTLSGTVAATNATDGNVGDGDLELALAGSKVTVSGPGSGFSLGNGLRLTGYCSSGYNTAYVYRQIWAGNQGISGGGGDTLLYDLWIASTSPQIKACVDFVCSDGTKLSAIANLTDFEGMAVGPATDLSGIANDQWYSRGMFLGGSLAGKTLTGIYLVLGGTGAGTYTAYFRRIIYQVSGGPNITIFGDTSTLPMNVQSLNIGYSAVDLAQVQVEDKASQTGHASISISAAGIVQSSQATWIELIPTGCTGIRETSIDGGATWQVATSGQAIPNLLPGMVATGVAVLYRDTLTIGSDPTVDLGFNRFDLIVNPAYASPKTDAVTTSTTATDFNTGTLTNLKTMGSGTTPGITLNGVQANFDLSSQFPSMTSFGIAGGGFFSVNKQLNVQCPTGGDTRARLDFAGLWQNFTTEVDISVPAANVQGGLAYRTTAWQNNNNTFAYMCIIQTTGIVLGRGTNSISGTGTFTNIASAALSLMPGSVHRLKLVIAGNTHQCYLDGTLLITATDATYPNAGNLGFRVFNGAGSTQSVTFDNFGVCSALSGTWQSPSINIAGPGTYGNSMIQWDIDELPDSTTSIAAQTSIDSGATWQNVTNGGAISGLTAAQSLAGKTLLLKLTLTASNAPVVPVLNGVTVWIMGQYSSTGTRSNAPLGNDTFARANQSGFGTSTDQQPWAVKSGSGIAAISGNTGTITNTGGGTTIIQLGSNTATDQGIKARVKYGNAATAIRVYARYSSASSGNGYSAYLSNNGFGIQKLSSGVYATLTSMSLPQTLGSYFWIHLVCVGTTIEASAWLDGQSEPTAFLLSTTDSSVASGGFGLGANLNTGDTATFNSFTATLWPDPTQYLASVGRAGTALINWNANTPPNTSLAVATSIDGGATYQAVASPGNAITGIAVQPAPIVDTFASNDSANYTQSNFGGGVTGSWTWDTVNSRLVGSGGTDGTIVNSTALTAADNQVVADFDQADGSGLIANYVDANDLYFVQIWDASGTSTQNAVKLFKRVSGVNVQLGSTATISFARGTYRRFVLDVQAGVLTVSMDGVQLIQQTDGSPLGAGKSGLLLNTLIRCYSLRIQQYGENVSALSLLTKLTLTSTDPTATPQVLDMQALVSSPTLAQGVLMPSSKYQNTFVSANIANLNKQSNYWWYVKSDKSVVFQPRNAVPAPWILSSANSQPIAGQQVGDVLVQNLNVQYSGDLYRNQQILTGAIDTALFTEIKAGDGQTRTWNVANPLTVPPTITLNGQLVSIGIKGVDTGKQYYYQLGSTSISQDSSQALLEEADTLSIVYTGSFSVDVTVNNIGGFPGTVSQSQMAAIDGSSGIVTAILDVSGTPMPKAAATTLGNQLLQRYGILNGRTLTFRTLHGGLQPGQQLTTFVPEENVMDVQFLIAQVDTTITTLARGALQYWYDVTACEGPVLGSWVRLFASGLGG